MNETRSHFGALLTLIVMGCLLWVIGRVGGAW